MGSSSASITISISNIREKMKNLRLNELKAIATNSCHRDYLKLKKAKIFSGQGRRKPIKLLKKHEKYLGIKRYRRVKKIF